MLRRALAVVCALAAASAPARSAIPIVRPPAALSAAPSPLPVPALSAVAPPAPVPAAVAAPDVSARSVLSAAAAPSPAPAARLAEAFDGAAPGERRWWGPLSAGAAVVPASSAFHELGHYVAARAAGRSATMRIDKVLIADHDSLPYPKRLAISLAGPAFNFLLAGASALAAAAAAGSWSWVLAGYAALNVLFGATNLIPDRPSVLGYAAGETGVSDGAHARDEWRAWRAARAEPAPTWEALAADDRRGAIPAEEGPGLDERLERLEASPEDRAAAGAAARAAAALAPRLARMPPAELRAVTDELRRRRRAGESLEALEPEALAAAAEACARTLGKRPYPEQVMAAAALRRGRVVQQLTGEGKTLSIALAAYVGALDGPVDVHTFNPYLAVRDAAEIGRPLSLLGLRVGALDGRDEAYLFSGRKDSPRHPDESALARLSRRELFRRADVVYGHTNAFVFAELFDQDASARSAQARAPRPKRFAIVDEADAAMMEEANSDFRIVSSGGADAADYGFVYALTGRWKAGEDFVLDEARREVSLTDGSRAYLAALRAADPGLPGAAHLELYARGALKARHLLVLDRDYAVVKDRVVILDPHTGRLMHGRVWEDGLTRFVEIKEGLESGGDDRLSSHMSLDAYFRLYGKVSGVSGTLDGTDAEFRDAYGLPAVRVPPHRPSRRLDLPDRLFRTREAKLAAVAAAALAARRAGRPVLIGAQDVAESAALARRLEDAGESFGLLNGLQDGESAVVARAGRPGALTVATQLAGRGTDVKLDDAARAAGGLLVLLTTMSDSPRVDRQYRGRAGRNGEPGESRLFVSLEDDVLARRATPQERAALAASFSADGEEASPEAAALLRAIQERAEASDAALRGLQRRRDEVLAPARARYFARRALWRALPLPFKGSVLAALQEGWSGFLAEHEDAWRGSEPGPDAAQTARAYDRLAGRPYRAALLPHRWAAGAARAAAAAVASFLRGSVYARVPAWAAARLAAPVGASALALGGRALAAARLRAPAAALLRGSLRLRPDDAPTRRALAAVLLERRDYGGAAGQFQEILARAWRARRQAQAGERRVVENAISGLAVSLSARARAASPAARARDLTLAFELDPTDERRRAAEAALAPLSPAERAAARTPPPYLALAYLDRARSSVDRGAFGNAEVYFSRVVDMDPSLATAYAGRAFAEKKLGEEDAAASDMFEAFRLRLLDTRQFRNMRLLYSLRVGASLDASRVERTFEALRRGETAAEPPAASESAREAALAERRRGREILEAGDARGALRRLDAALRLDPRLAGAYDDRAVARARLGDLRGAYEDFADSLLWEVLGGEGEAAWDRLIVGHQTLAKWTPAPGTLAAFVARLKSL